MPIHQPPAVSENTKLSLTPNGNIRYQLKTPYRDGTTHVIFEAAGLHCKTGSAGAKTRVNLTMVEVFAPNSQHRALVTPARQGKASNQNRERQSKSKPAERRVSMTWAQRLKRVFNIDIETCSACGAMKLYCQY